MSRRSLTARIGILVFAVAPLAAWAQQAAWKPATAPIMTRWAAGVPADRPLPEYPRPQMIRRQWANLNGLWDYAITDSADRPAGYSGHIRVPFPVESALSGVMKPVRPAQRLWYRRTVKVPGGWRSGGQRVLLHFGAVDYQTEAFVNGTSVGTHAGGYDPFTFDITDALQPGEDQELMVRVADPTDAGSQPHGKQVLRPGGIMYTAVTGIWQTVWMEPVPAAHIVSLHITPDIDAGAVRVAVEATEGAGEVTVTAKEGSRAIGSATGGAGAEVTIPIPNARLWTPETPFLYNLTVKLASGDSVDSYFGMRKIALGKDAQGITRPMLNGKFVFQVGPLDQGFWPDGIYTAPSDEALRWDIETTKKLGFNMTRKHVKVEPDRWYYWCDRLGLLVWQDMPAGSNQGEAAHAQYEAELESMIRTHWSHPCIIQWVVFNEGWGQYDTERIVPWVKQLDPSRLVDNASGWTDKGVGDVIDMHNYPGPGSPKPEESRAAVLGEFGGLGLATPGHTWSASGWGYRQEANPARLTRGYVSLLRRSWDLKESAGLSAVVYTQITDVETELNGMITYDRKVFKVAPRQGALANRGEFASFPAPVVVVPTDQMWRYTTEQPAADWFQPGFADTGWAEGRAGFAGGQVPAIRRGTNWRTDDIWLRRHFTFSGGTKGLLLQMFHDEDAEVYINGVLGARVTGYTTDYELFDIDAAALKALKQGDNVLAIHCHQTGGGQGIDAGLVRQP